MNLRAIANSVTCGINPNTQATLKQNNGFLVADDGSQVASYTEIPVTIQVQALSTKDLLHLGDMAQQGQYTTIYINGLIDAQVRSLAKGEDLVVFDDTTWKVTSVEERYSNIWTRALVCRQ